MMTLDWGTLGCFLGGVLLGWGIAYTMDTISRPVPEDLVSSRIRYVGEEHAATKACGKRKVISWWLENPRKSAVTMHVKCAGSAIVTEVNF